MASDSSQDDLSSYLNLPCNINGFQFKGVRKTNRNLLRKIVTDALKTETLGDYLVKKTNLERKLEDLDAFSNIEVVLIHKSGNDFDIKLNVEEKGPITATVRTDIDANSNYHLNLRARFPNLNGIGDDAAFSTKFNKSYYFFESRYSLPLSPWRQFWAPRYSVLFNFNTWDHLPSDYDQKDKAFSNLIEFSSSSQLRHSISFDNVWRAIRSSSNSTPLEIRKFAGHSLKTALKYIVSYNSRDDFRFPQSGCLFRLSNEVAFSLFDKSAKFSKHEIHFQFNKNILPRMDLLCQFNLAAGLLHQVRANICDKFFVGGPVNFRGFKINGLGPNASGSPLGGETYMTAGLHVYPPMPYNREISDLVRPHIFLNAGTIGDWRDLTRISARKEDIKKEIESFKESLRYSCGVGLVLRMGSIRIELNYCLPLVTQSTDLSSTGIQFGFGLNI